LMDAPDVSPIVNPAKYEGPERRAEVATLNRGEVSPPAHPPG